MSRVAIIARREYLENVRTKTFWIGILIFPVVLVLIGAGAAWLETTKDVRKYAVVDHSGWLLKAVEDAASGPDLEKVFSNAISAYKSNKDSLNRFPDAIRHITPIIAGLKPNEVNLLARQFAVATAPESTLPLPEPAVKALKELHTTIREWWRGLPAEEAAKYAKDASKSRYQLVSMPGEGDALLNKLNDMVKHGKLFAYFVIGKDPISGSDGCKYVSNNLTDLELKDWFASTASDVVKSRRIVQRGIDEAVARWIQEPIVFEAGKVSASGVAESVDVTDIINQWAPVAFVYLLILTVMIAGQMLLYNTVEEKSNKVIEILLSSVSPKELMTGKIIGIAATGMTVIASWVIMLITAIKTMPYILRDFPTIDLWQTLGGTSIALFIAYYLLGFLLYAALYAAIGSMCSNLKEAQNLVAPLSILMVLPMIAMVPVSRDPNGLLAKILSYVPPLTPFIMLNRTAGPPTAVEYILTTVLLVVSIAAAFWAAAKVFRIGILMTGKPPRLREIIKWIVN